MERTVFCGDLCGSQRLQGEDGVYDKNENMLKKYIAREPDAEVDVEPTSNKDSAPVVVAGVIHKDTDPELGEVPDLQHALNDLIRRYPDVFTDMPRKTDSA